MRARGPGGRRRVGPVATLGGTHDTGYRMCMRSSYVNNSSGDNVNSTTHGAWKYFLFTK
ncbi:hypothetical protein [Streptomyces sp. NPDC002205]|uniref:hypothetical protein n=1 Tax=Streptomyces sp. NPDC002205 TaxID=3154411 RepID=UPI003322A2A6